MKLGICCVYFYGEDSEWLLELQLRYLASTLAGYDYTIYAAANRLRFELRQILERAPCLRIVSLPQFEGTGSPEHGFYLDLLLQHAADDGCTHLATVDADSFPVLPDWPTILLKRMKGARLAAVLRSENLDTHLPHPCGLFMQRAFFLDCAPRMLPPRSEILEDASFREFLKETRQRVDTGIGYGYALWRSQEAWLPLLRSNRRNPHFLMAGMYGHIFFHLGASSRRPWFYRDQLKKLCLRIGPLFGSTPILWRLRPWLDERYIESNRRLLLRIAGSLRSDPDRYLAQL